MIDPEDIIQKQLTTVSSHLLVICGSHVSVLSDGSSRVIHSKVFRSHRPNSCRLRCRCEQPHMHDAALKTLAGGTTFLFLKLATFFKEETEDCSTRSNESKTPPYDADDTDFLAISEKKGS